MSLSDIIDTDFHYFQYFHLMTPLTATSLMRHYVTFDDAMSMPVTSPLLDSISIF